MRIVLLGHEDVASLYALSRLCRALPEHDFSVFWSGSVTTKTAPDRPLSELATLDRQLFERLLAAPGTDAMFRHALALTTPNAGKDLATLAALEPDLVVSIRYRRILKDAAIAVPRHGVLNLHSGILPDYRGVMATFWAMLNGESEIGSTLHWIVDAGIDTGPVIDIARRAADYSRSYLWNVLALYADGCKLLQRSISAIGRGEVPSGAHQAQNEGQYFGPPNDADVAIFGRKGLKLADGTEAGLL